MRAPVHRQDEVHGYARAFDSDESVSAALTFAAASDGILVATTDAVAAALDGASVPLRYDARHTTVAEALPQRATPTAAPAGRAWQRGV